MRRSRLTGPQSRLCMPGRAPDATLVQLLQKQDNKHTHTHTHKAPAPTTAYPPPKTSALDQPRPLGTSHLEFVHKEWSTVPALLTRTQWSAAARWCATGKKAPTPRRRARTILPWRGHDARAHGRRRSSAARSSNQHGAPTQRCPPRATASQHRPYDWPASQHRPKSAVSPRRLFVLPIS